MQQLARVLKSKSAISTCIAAVGIATIWWLTSGVGPVRMLSESTGTYQDGTWRMVGNGHAARSSESGISPTVLGIRSTAFFDEPLVPIGTTTAEQTTQLASALEGYSTTLRQPGERTRFESLSDFIGSHPQAAWQPSRLLNTVLLYRETGNFLKALPALQAAWQGAKGATPPDGRAVGDAAGAHLSQMYTYIGRREELKSNPSAMKASDTYDDADRPTQVEFSDLIIHLAQPYPLKQRAIHFKVSNSVVHTYKFKFQAFLRRP